MGTGLKKESYGATQPPMSIASDKLSGNAYAPASQMPWRRIPLNTRGDLFQFIAATSRAAITLDLSLLVFP